MKRKNSFFLLLAVACLFFLIQPILGAPKPPEYNVTITINPAVTGGQWGLSDGTSWGLLSGTGWTDSGRSQQVLAGQYSVILKPLQDKNPPKPLEVTIVDNPFSTTLSYDSSVIGSVSDTDLANWPTWPKKARTTNVWEPATFTSIGRDTMAWVDFDPVSSNPSMIKAGLFFLSKDPNSTIYRTVIPSTGSLVSFDVVWNTNTAPFPSNYDSQFLSNLRNNSILPVSKENWLEGSFPNEFPIASGGWPNFSLWESFFRGNSDFVFADTGHAPPVLSWAADPWLLAYKTKTGYNPISALPDWYSGGKERIFAFLSTNQGVLNGFEVFESASPTIDRKWIFMPSIATRQAFYHNVQRALNGKYARLTPLDGPFTIRDVENSSGNYRRILIGTTGVGTKQVSKPFYTWKDQGATKNPRAFSEPSMADLGRVFGVYALNITNPLAPSQLWEKKNIEYSRSWKESNGTIKTGEKKDLDLAIGEDPLRFSVAKPLIGYTRVAGARKWQAVILGVTKSGKYAWFVLDPMTGSILKDALGNDMKGYFNGYYDGTSIYESLPTKSLFGEAEPENWEDFYPSRILAAFPYGGTEPVLSDVYIYLSNGSLFKWNLNAVATTQKPNEDKPRWIVTFATKDGDPAPPITDFDVSYIESTSGDISTYFAVPVPLSYNPAAHDTVGLLAFNFDEIEALPSTSKDPKLLKGPPGMNTAQLDTNDGGTTLTLQIQDKNGAITYDGQEMIASPVFILNRLYEAVYLNKGSSGASVSMLYAINFKTIQDKIKGNSSYKMGKGGTTVESLASEDYATIQGKEAISLMIDSQGNLVVLFADGSTKAIPTGLPPVEGVGGGNQNPSYKISLVYWKVNNP